MGQYTGDEIYWALESSFPGSVMDGTDTHQAFNPIEGDVNIGAIKPKYVTALIYASHSLDVYEKHSNEYKPGKGAFPNDKGAVYRSPFLMLALVFTHKTVGAWSPYTIAGDFTDDDDEDSIKIQYKKSGGANAISRCINGVTATDYTLSYKKGDVLRERATLQGGDVASNTHAFSADANFDDGNWQDWAKSTFYPASDIDLTWGGNTINTTNHGFEVKECEFKFGIGKKYDAYASSLTTAQKHLENRSYETTLTGVVTDNDLIQEAEAKASAKTYATLKMEWDSSNNKYVQVTNAFVETMDSNWTARSTAEEGTVVFKSTGTGSYSGTFTASETDPSGRITS